MFVEVWRKMSESAPLSALEDLIAGVIRGHPEYHELLAAPEEALQLEDASENPFLHMGLHIALAEQLQANRPGGIRAAYQRLLMLSGDNHTTEHKMMQCLGEMLWQASQRGVPPDEKIYLKRLGELK